MLTKAFPPELVDEVVDHAGAKEQRDRDLPARLTVYFTLALWLYVTSGYEYVMARLLDGLLWARRSLSDRRVPRAASLARARDRLGPDALHLLFERVAGPVATPETAGAFWRDLRLVSLDGATLDVPATSANELIWGRPADEGMPAKFPQVRLLALAECGTHAVIDATFGPYAMENEDLARRLLRHVGPGMMLLTNLHRSVGDLLVDAARTGAAVVWRLPNPQGLSVRGELPDGTYLSHLDHTATGEAVGIRVIHCSVNGECASESFWLATTLTDPNEAPRSEVARLYLERWKLPTAIAAFNIESPGTGAIALRSRTPHGVAQEIWAMFCVHQALRDLIVQTTTVDQIIPS